jgi:LacI family transcriptional regulator
VAEYTGTDKIAVICPLSVKPNKTDISPFMVNAIAVALKDTGFVPLLFDSESVCRSFDAALEQKAAGILLNVYDRASLQSRVARAESMGLPVVFLDKKGPGGGFVGTDHYRGALKGVEKALALGYDRIYHFFENTDVSSVVERKLGYAHAMTLANLNTRLIPVDTSGEDYIARFYEAMTENKGILHEKCAIFTTNGDGMTGVWRAVREIAPREYPALISFDDPDIVLPAGAPFVNIVQDLQAIGAEAVGMLLTRITKGAGPSEKRISPEIRVVTGGRQ